MLHLGGKDREINDTKVMTEQGTHERVLIRVDIFFMHTLTEAEPSVMGVRVCACEYKGLFDNSSGEGNECLIIHSNKNLMRNR